MTRLDPTPAPVSPTGAPATAAPARDWLIDILRVVSVLVVIALHWIYQRVTVVDGETQVHHALNGRPVWILTWVLMVMPVFFIAGGFANSLIFDRTREKGQTYGEFLGLRARRLMTPLVPLIVVTLLVDLIGGQISPGIGHMVGDQIGNVLWFLAVYLVCVATTPVCVRLHERHGWWLVPGILLAASIAVDTVRFTGGDFPDPHVNLVLVWLFCHQLGVLHHRRTLAGVPTAGLLGLVGVVVGVLWVMVVPGPWYPTNIGVGDSEISNIMPPTSALSVLGIAHLALITCGSRRMAGWQPSGRLAKLIGTMNLLLMLLYLWHLPAFVVMTGLGLLYPEALLPTDVLTWWAIRPLWFALAGAMLALMVMGALRWEAFMQRFKARTDTTTVAVGAFLGVVSVFLLWRLGIVIEPIPLAAAAGALGSAWLLTTFTRLARTPKA